VRNFESNSHIRSSTKIYQIEYQNISYQVQKYFIFSTKIYISDQVQKYNSTYQTILDCAPKYFRLCSKIF